MYVMADSELYPIRLEDKNKCLTVVENKGGVHVDVFCCPFFKQHVITAVTG